MADHETDRARILAATSPAFRQLHAAIGDMLAQRFPDVEPVQEYGMAAFAVPVPDPPADEDWTGTMPRTHLTVGPTEKKAGITVHVWHPKAPDLLDRHAERLRAAGFKPMVGCLQWNRKAPFPLDEFGRLLDEAKAAF